MTLPLPSPRTHKGFTLIELLIAITIIALISVVGFTTFSQSQMRARDSRRKQDLKAITVALELFYQKNGRYPCSGTGWSNSSLSSWLSDSAAGSCGGTGSSIVPNYISAMPKDPVLNEANSESKDKRGYAYYSIDAAHGNACTKGQYYVLVTHLENTNDPEALKATKTICGNVAYTVGTYGDNAYILNLP